ncbi:SUMF1/EgtB/PvdO family nonheme iron enzyme [Scytonema sp. UIC 10036]|nr:SUMF1/EgtB/PvdO family nonheme iron enzyme [Scytonema sp. UIC 10036]
MVQDAMVPLSEQMHVAEVLLSGLFRLATPIEAHTNPDEIEYKFSDEEIRRILLDSTPVTDTFKILSSWIGKRLGKSINEFLAILRTPESNSAAQQALPFAEVAIQVLKRQGGKYGDFATNLEQRLRPSQFTEQDLFLSELPPLKTFEFEVATISIEDEDGTDTSSDINSSDISIEDGDGTDTSSDINSSDINLQPFEFEVATIERKKSGRLQWKTELIVKQSRKQAWGFIEDLGNGVQLEMVAIPKGSFLMGSPEDEPERRSNESPQHTVTIKSFFFSKYPLTQAQWRAVASLPQVKRKLNPDPSGFKGENRPVEKISWYSCVEFCDRLSRYTNKTYRLPSEAEWEYACRAGTTTPFHFGETLTSDLANYNVYCKETRPVGSFGVANAFGLYDMHGQVWEWCADHWHRNYEGAPTNGEAWINQVKKNDNQERILRGGSWDNLPVNCRSACRHKDLPDLAYSSLGFRVVCGV